MMTMLFLLVYLPVFAAACARPITASKNCLQEFCQAKKLPLPKYVVDVAGPAHALQYRAECAMVDGAFTGDWFSTKKMAEGSAAAAALEALGISSSDYASKLQTVQPPAAPKDNPSETTNPAPNALNDLRSLAVANDWSPPYKWDV